jgi:ribonuclease Z
LASPNKKRGDHQNSKTQRSMSNQFSITILGSSSAIPTKDRFPTSQLLSCYGRHYLIDCGEGTQIQLRKYKISFQRIDHIFISHVHADHFLGLPGLLSTMDLLGRERELHIHAHEELHLFMDGFTKTTYNGFSFPVHYHPIEKKKAGVLFENAHIEVHTFPVKHSIPCNGFLLKEKQKLPNLKKELVLQYNPTIEEIHQIKAGGDFTTADGKIIKNEDFTLPAAPARSYAFVTDTCYYENILPFIENVDLLYHEATFGEDMKERAKSTQHSTAQQAATMALKAHAKRLMIGHYSVRYEDIQVLLNEAKSVFENTFCATEGLEVQL